MCACFFSISSVRSARKWRKDLFQIRPGYLCSLPTEIKFELNKTQRRSRQAPRRGAMVPPSPLEHLSQETKGATQENKTRQALFNWHPSMKNSQRAGQRRKYPRHSTCSALASWASSGSLPLGKATISSNFLSLCVPFSLNLSISLTPPFASLSAPAARRSSTAAVWPLVEAKMRAV